MFDSKIKLSDLQLLLIKTFWLHGKLSATEVHKIVSAKRDLAPTTVATMLKRMEEKQWLAYEKQGRQFLYFANITENDVKTSMLSNLLTNLFNGDPEELVNHLVRSEEVAQDDLKKIQSLIENASEKPGDD